MRVYGELALTEASPAQTFTEPLSLTEVKTFLRITDSSPADTNQDTLLETFITAAREMAEILQRRDLITKQYDLRLSDFVSYETYIGVQEESGIPLRTPLQSVDLVQYTDSDGVTTTLTETTEYVVDTHRGLLLPPYGESFPSFVGHPVTPVLIRFTSGYDADHSFWTLDVGKRIKVGMLQLISLWYDERLPFAPAIKGLAIAEIPFSITVLLTTSAKERVF